MASYSSSSPPPRPGAIIQVFILFLTLFVLSSNTYETNSSSAAQHTALVHSYPTNKTSSTDHPNPNGKKPPRKRSPPPPSPPPPPPPSPPPPPPEFEYYTLELIWPPSLCKRLDGPKCVEESKEIPKRWTIHGLWPNGRLDCNPGDKLNVDKLLKEMRKELMLKWPSVLKSTTHTQFWTNEWAKHGTCSGLTQRDYFKNTLKYYDTISDVKYNLQQINVFPSQDRTYNPTTVTADYVTEYKGKRPWMIRCFDKSSNPHQEMLGIFRFKIYKNGSLDDTITEPTNCTTTRVQYPNTA